MWICSVLAEMGLGTIGPIPNAASRWSGALALVESPAGWFLRLCGDFINQSTANVFYMSFCFSLSR